MDKMTVAQLIRTLKWMQKEHGSNFTLVGLECSKPNPTTTKVIVDVDGTIKLSLIQSVPA
jgi:hypothetical protein